jgi:hypothetical protein
LVAGVGGEDEFQPVLVVGSRFPAAGGDVSPARESWAGSDGEDVKRGDPLLDGAELPALLGHVVTEEVPADVRVERLAGVLDVIVRHE